MCTSCQVAPPAVNPRERARRRIRARRRLLHKLRGLERLRQRTLDSLGRRIDRTRETIADLEAAICADLRRSGQPLIERHTVYYPVRVGRRHDELSCGNVHSAFVRDEAERALCRTQNRENAR